MARKGENIYRRADGRWEGRYIASRDELTGKIKYGYIYGRTYSEVKRKKKEKGRELQEKKEAERDLRLKTSVKECFDKWIAWKETDPTIHQTTLDQYRRHLEKHIYPELGSYRMSQLTSQVIDRFRADKLDQGRLDGDGGLSAGTVNTLMFLIYNVLDYAQEEGFISEVPQRRTKRTVNPEKKEVRVFSRKEQDRIEQVLSRHFKPDSCGAACIGIFFALYTGLRVGEVSALQWQDMDLDPEHARVIVRHTLQRRTLTNGGSTKTSLLLGPPKSRHSRRSFPLKKELVTILREYYEGLPDKLKQPDSPVFSLDGGYIEPRVFQKKLKWVLEKAEVEDANFHALRHTFATRCIESNMDVQTLSECLGHSSANVTLNVYAHSFAEHKKYCMNKLKFLSYMEAMGRIKKDPPEPTENV